MDELVRYLYDFDEADGCFVIKLSPAKYLDIFNNLDPYPIRKRDINQHVVNYIEDCSSDIPLKQKIKIEIKIKDEARNEDLEQRTTKGIRNYFRYILEYHQRRAREVVNTSIAYVVVFVMLTVSALVLEPLDIPVNRIFATTVLEGLSIGSWVFLWEAIAGVAIKNKQNRFQIRTYKRLAGCALTFHYSDETAAPAR